MLLPLLPGADGDWITEAMRHGIELPLGGGR